MTKTSFEMAFTATLDEHGVLDGRELAGELVTLAYKMAAAYVDGCPACADHLFSVIANDAISRLHSDREEGSGVPTWVLAPAEGADIQRHFEAAEEQTAALLARGGASPHRH